MRCAARTARDSIAIQAVQPQVYGNNAGEIDKKYRRIYVVISMYEQASRNGVDGAPI